jgi:hypothetical protein
MSIVLTIFSMCGHVRHGRERGKEIELGFSSLLMRRCEIKQRNLGDLN